MTRRQDIESHRKSLGDIRNIMNSIKTLAYMETRKLARFADAQNAVVESIEVVAADFLSFHADRLPETGAKTQAYLLIGTERGFCRDFNHAVVRQLESTLASGPASSPVLIAVGHKLHALLEHDTRVTARIDGASVAEEVTLVLGQIVRTLYSLQQRHGTLSVHGLYNGGDNGVVVRQLLPPFVQHRHQPPHHPHPPVMNLPPAGFLIELSEQHLFATLHAMLYASLMAENQKRVKHLEGAVRHLDDESAELARKSNVLRQEEIIEEIEVILLSAGSLEEPWHRYLPAITDDSTQDRS